MVYRRRLKHHLVRIASRLALSGLVLLLLALISALLLTLDVVIGLGPALVLAVGALGWFVTWWFVLPVWSRIRHQAFAGTCRMSRTTACSRRDRPTAPGPAAGARRVPGGGYPVTRVKHPGHGSETASA